MKKLMIFSSLFLIMMLTSCTYVNTIDKEIYEELLNYHETIGKKCIEYVNNDSSLNARSKNTFLRKYELMDETLKTKIKVKE